MKKIRDKVFQNKIIRLIYLGKTYNNIANSQIGFFTGRLVEIFALIALTEKLFQIEILGANAAMFITAIFILAIIAGYIFKGTGIYDVDEYTMASKNPVQKEILEAARKINNDPRYK